MLAKKIEDADEVSPRTLKCGDFITFMDQTSGFPRQAFFLAMLDKDGETFVCLGESGKGYIGKGGVIRVERLMQTTLAMQKRIRKIMEVQ